MKKMLLLATALIVALLAGEGFVRFGIDYPVYGVSKKVHYRQGKEYWMNMWKPYSRYWNVEGGNRVFRHNNLGLPGNDIDTTRQNNLAVLGTSYIEAYQIEPDRMATSILDSLLRAKGNDVAVYNLGCSGHDIYDLWFRLKYFQTMYEFQSIMLVVETDFTNRLCLYKKPLNFKEDSTFGQINNSFRDRMLTSSRNVSALSALLLKSYATRKAGKIPDSEQYSKARNLKLSEEFTHCLDMFDQTYGQRFVLVNIAEESSFSSDLAAYCLKHDIQLVSRPLIKSELMLHGSGHLNASGNKELGWLLEQAYASYLYNTDKQSKAH